MAQFFLSQLPLLVLLVISVFLTSRDPRRIKCAIWWGVTVNYSLLSLSGAAALLLVSVPENVELIVLLVSAAGLLLAVLVLGILLILYGVRLIRKESFSLAHSLSLALGIVILLYPALLIIFAMQDEFRIWVYLLALGFPITYLAFVLVSYLVYAAFYGAWAKRFAPTPEVVVVLGAGLDGDRLTPLLRARANLGLEVYWEAEARGTDPVLVGSGGQGPGGLVAEGAALGNYFKEAGATRVVEEDASTTTEENLDYTRRLFPASTAPWMAVTSDYHAFRAALLLRQLDISGNAVGAKTPRYFWASAVLREFAALLRRHWKLNAVMLALSCVPLAATLFVAIFQL